MILRSLLFLNSRPDSFSAITWGNITAHDEEDNEKGVRVPSRGAERRVLEHPPTSKCPDLA
jgi:hypothetical protein